MVCKCGCDEVIQREVKTHVGEYCQQCDKWIRWVPRTEAGLKPRSLQSTHAAIKPKQRAEILLRANRRCELCGQSRDLQVGHLISAASGMKSGMTDAEINSEENLSAMCGECNTGLGAQPVPLRLAVSMVMARVRRGSNG